jgi:hypothetical protein
MSLFVAQLLDTSISVAEWLLLLPSLVVEANLKMLDLI